MRGQRRKLVMCVICKEEQTFNLDSICIQCIADAKSGREQRLLSRQRDSGIETFYFDQYVLNTYASQGRTEMNTVSMVETLTGRKVKTFTSCYSVLKDLKMNDPLPDVIISQAKTLREFGTDHTIASVDLPRSVGMVLRQLIVSTLERLEEAEIDGLRRGRSFITQMALGSMSIDEINYLHTQTDKKTGVI